MNCEMSNKLWFGIVCFALSFMHLLEHNTDPPEVDADHIEAVPGLHQLVVGLALPLGGHDLRLGLDPGLGLGGHVALDGVS